MRVEAAGGVIVRDGEAGTEVLPGPPPPLRRLDASRRASSTRARASRTAALREVEEETGLRCTLEAELPSAEYRDNKDRPKIVRYWQMEVDEDPGFEPNDEVDELRWLPMAEAAELLTYERDRGLLERALS